MRWSTPDNNTTLYLGAGLTRDDINLVNGVVENEHKRSNEFMIGVTRRGRRTISSSSTSAIAAASGYFNDPYKLVTSARGSATRPPTLARWNHHIEPLGVTIRLQLPFLSRHLRHSAPTRPPSRARTRWASVSR